MLRRLEAAGRLPGGSDVARRSIPQEEIAQLLAYAAMGDSGGIAASHLRKFREEFPTPQPHGVTRADASLTPLYRLGEGLVRTGIGYDTVWTGARPLADERAGDVRARVGLLSRHAGVVIAGDRDGIAELQVVLTAGAAGAWIGRRALGYAPAHGGGVVLDVERFDGGGFFLTRPLRLPLLGSTRLETHLTKIDNVLALDGSQAPTEPWFWTARAAFEPHARVRIGVTRGLMFGGEGNLPVTFSRVVRNLIGDYTADGENSFANQLLSVDLRYRVPGFALPLSVYLDWGADDASGGWWDVPGIVAGFEISVLPQRDLLFGIERTEFLHNESSNSIWYQNAWFRGSWADGGAAFGHPLGGHGREWRIFAAGGAPAASISGSAALYRRWRGDQNLYAPERSGHSTGGTFGIDARLSRALRVQLAAEIENGGDWTATRVQAGVRAGF